MHATYHNHSRWSDGQATIAELVDASRRMNVDELGISDHWVLHPKGMQFDWAMRTDGLGEYVSEIKGLREALTHRTAPLLRLGLEVDWHPGNSSRLRDVLDQYPFDYVIGSVHEVRLLKGCEFMVDASAAAWKKLTQDERDQAYRQYWLNVKSLAECGVFDIVAHIDLPKKFAAQPMIDLSREICGALDAIAAARTVSGGPLVVELNTAGWHKPCNDAYPTLEILAACRRRNIPVTISADAHQPEHLVRDFDRAAERLAMAGYSTVARFAQREMRHVALQRQPCN